MERQAAKQKAFLTMVCGGPHNYTGMDMRKGHAHLVKQGLNDVHFDAVAEHLGGTLEELGVARPLIEQVLQAAESMRADVLEPLARGDTPMSRVRYDSAVVPAGARRVRAGGAAAPGRLRAACVQGGGVPVLPDARGERRGARAGPGGAQGDAQGAQLLPRVLLPARAGHRAGAGRGRRGAAGPRAARGAGDAERGGAARAPASGGAVRLPGRASTSRCCAGMGWRAATRWRACRARGCWSCTCACCPAGR